MSRLFVVILKCFKLLDMSYLLKKNTGCSKQRLSFLEIWLISLW